MDVLLGMSAMVVWFLGFIALFAYGLNRWEFYLHTKPKTHRMMCEAADLFNYVIVNESSWRARLFARTKYRIEPCALDNGASVHDLWRYLVRRSHTVELSKGVISVDGVRYRVSPMLSLNSGL